MKPYYKCKYGELYQGDCLEVMRSIPENYVDLTVTSQPYDNLRAYNGYSFDFEGIANELYRITKQGGVIVWIVGDATVKGSETGTSFKQALHFKEIGFNLETMIWEKTGSGCLGSNKLYAQNFEYMFILSKGSILTHNLIQDRENKVKQGTATVNGSIDDTGKGKNRIIERREFGKRNNIWKFDPKKNSNHPAPFPEKLANDHIISWSNEGDLVFDPFTGSGTTSKMAVLSNRKFIGAEISEEYCEIAAKRIEDAVQLIKNFEV